jgi:hypothetical protein
MANNEQRDFPMADGMFPPPSARNDLVIDAVYRRALTARLDRLSGVQRRIAQPLIDPVVAAIAAACPTILAPTRFGMRLAPVPQCGPDPAFWLIAATTGAVVRAEAAALPVTAGVSPGVPTQARIWTWAIGFIRDNRADDVLDTVVCLLGQSGVDFLTQTFRAFRHHRCTPGLVMLCGRADGVSSGILLPLALPASLQMRFAAPGMT